MTRQTFEIDQHYGKGGILRSIIDALPAVLGEDRAPAPVDLAPVDEFHNRGRAATLELAELAGFGPGDRIIDIGCGLGGSARYLAGERGCRVSGIDATREYVEAAEELARMVGLDGEVSFRQGNALALPFEDSSFDGAWTEHVQMNVPDKAAFFGEIARVLRPDGAVAFHEILAGEGGEPLYPVPWAGAADISFLAAEPVIRDALVRSKLALIEWRDTTDASLEWARATAGRIRESGPPPLGLHLLMGESAPTKLGNMIRNMQTGAIRVVQGVARLAAPPAACPEIPDPGENAG